MTTAPRLLACLLAMGPVRRRRRLLALVADIEGGTRSTLERRFVRLLRRAGLPLPRRNHPVVSHGRRLWIDCCYPERRIAIVIDGKAYHVLSDDWEHDLERQNLVALDGWLILRFTAKSIRDEPALVVAQVRAALNRDARVA